MPSNKKALGFTLVEVLVALVVFSVGALSLTYAVSNAVDNQRVLENKTLGAWQARNQLVQLRIAGFPDIGITKDNQTYSQRDWLITTRITAVNIPVFGGMLRQVQIDVADKQNPVIVLQSLRAVLGEH